MLCKSRLAVLRRAPRHFRWLTEPPPHRLLRDLHETERNLAFWRSRLIAGAHGRFMLLGRGPASFAYTLARSLLSVLGFKHHDDWSDATATDKIQGRINILEAHRSCVATCIGQLQAAGAHLRLLQQAHWAAGSDGAALPLGVPAPGAQVPSLTSDSSGEQQAGRGLQRSVAGAIQRSAHDTLRALTHLRLSTSALADQESLSFIQKQELQRQLISGWSDGAAADGVQSALDCGARTALTGASLRAAGRQDSASPSDSAAQRADGVAESAEELVRRLKDVAGVKPSAASAGGPPPSPSSVLNRARRAAARSAPLSPVPRWSRMPSRFQRYWLRYTALGVAAAGGLRFLYRHSRLAGSSDLDDWARQATTSVSGAWRDHIIAPLSTVRDELFKTLRDRPSIVSSAEYESDKASLQRMIHDFVADRGGGGGGGGGSKKVSPASAATPGGGIAGGGSYVTLQPTAGGAGGGGDAAAAAAADTALLAGMQSVMSSYEQEMRSPIRNLVAGDLARCLLIQVQRLKVDTEAAMLELDQILRSNELSISLVAAVPGLIFR